MRALTAPEIFGTWATVLTPFHDDDTLNLEALDRELDLIIAAKPEGIYTHGTAGEFFNQTEKEWEAVATAVAKRCETAGVPFQLGASHPSPIMALDRIKRARQIKPSAIQIILPDWVCLNTDEIRSVISTYSETADGVGLVLYNPPHAKNVLGPAELDVLTQEFTAIVGVKVADGDDDWYTLMAATLRRISVFVPGHHVATGLTKGARGAYSNVACLHPSGAVEWASRSIEDPEWGLRVEAQINTFLTVALAPLIAKNYSNVTLDKALAMAGGHLGDVGHVRWPHATATPREISRIRNAARDMLPEFLTPAADE
ncbi:dihydrodipicolinate synthase family protein [Rhodoglobus aureus]|uniref:Dihydrodipicolinate synthase family protein n=1 Tax=Rhodoglobus aureus TaxID=191497 RepID=A0ABN1VWV4_9MICO